MLVNKYSKSNRNIPNFGPQKSPDVKKMSVVFHFAHHLPLLHFHQIFFYLVHIIGKGYLKENIYAHTNKEVSL